MSERISLAELQALVKSAFDFMHELRESRRLTTDADDTLNEPGASDAANA